MSSPPQSSRPAILILAAGGSERLGQPKQLVHFEGEPLLRRAAKTALAAGIGPVFVVLGAAEYSCQAALEGLGVESIRNANWRLGMSTSIRLGIERIMGLESDSALLMLCDQPLVTAAHLRALAASALLADADPRLDAVATEYDNVIGVPALFHRRLFGALLTLHGDRGAKELLQQRQANCRGIPLAGAAVDVDTAADVSKLNAQSPPT